MKQEVQRRERENTYCHLLHVCRYGHFARQQFFYYLGIKNNK